MSIKPLLPIAAAAGALALAPPALAAPPSNDAFETPAALGDAPSSTTGTLDQATTQAGEPSHGTQTVWYAFRPAVSRRVAVEIPEQNTSTVLSVYTGSTVSGLSRVATTSWYEPRVAFDAVAGREYRVAVGAQYEASGTRFTLRSRVAPLPANDAFDDAARITVPKLYSGNLADATTELGESARHRHSVWYRFKPTHPTGRVTLDVSRSGASMWLYRGRELSSLHLLNSGSTIRFTPRRGTAYRLAVGRHGDPGFGDFTLDVSNNSIKGKGVKLELGDGQTLADVRADGLRGIVSARRRTTVDVRLEVSRRTARRLRLRSRVLGHAGGVVDYDEALPAVIKLSRRARRALAHEDSLHATVVLELPGSPVRDRFIRRHVTL
jgi:hypothetical protein